MLRPASMFAQCNLRRKAEHHGMPNDVGKIVTLKQNGKVKLSQCNRNASKLEQGIADHRRTDACVHDASERPQYDTDKE